MGAIIKRVQKRIEEVKTSTSYNNLLLNYFNFLFFRQCINCRGSIRPPPDSSPPPPPTHPPRNKNKNVQRIFNQSTNLLHTFIILSHISLFPRQMKSKVCKSFVPKLRPTCYINYQKLAENLMAAVFPNGRRGTCVLMKDC